MSKNKIEPMPPKGSPKLYKKACELHKRVFNKAIWNKDKYKVKTGHMLQSLYGRSVWTLKDLNDNELLKIIEICENKIKNHPLKFNKII